MRTARRVLGVLLVAAVAAGVTFWLRPVECFNEMTYAREFITGVENHETTVGGYRIHYLAEGPASGPVVVLVHGLGGRAEDWLNLAPWLKRAGYRVYMPDLLGYGRSEKPADFSYSITDEAGVVIGFMDALGLKQVDLGGWSMGGWIVQILAAKHPERVKRLMLFDAAGIDERPDWNTALFTPTTPGQLDQLEALLMPHPHAIPGFISRDVLRVSKQNAWVVRRALDDMLTGREATNSLLPELKMPVLIEWGAEDRVVPLKQAETMHRLIPQSVLNVAQGCGHLAPEQCTKQMGPQVVGFLEAGNKE
jgi:pimeloyl-ACP methyl ester carboxylesterase